MPGLEHQPPRNIEVFKLLYSNGELEPGDCVDALKDIEVCTPSSTSTKKYTQLTHHLLQKRWPHAYDAIGDEYVLCHIVRIFRTLEVDLPHSRLQDFLVLCSRLVKEVPEISLESNYANIGRSSIKRIEDTACNISDIRNETFTIYNDIPSVLERRIDDFERAATTLQESRNPTGVPIAGSTLELWNRTDDDNDDSAVLRATAIHAFGLRQLAGQFRFSLATAKKDAENKEAAAQMQDGDTEMV